VADRPDIPSDSDLVRAVWLGDTAAFDGLVDRYLGAVYGVARRIVGQAADAEDVAQDTFVRAYERLYLYDVEQSFRNWVLKIATNLAINRLRSRRRERVLRINVAQQKQQEGKDESETPVGPAGLNARAWEYWLGQLNEKQRTAIVLFHFQQMPYAEIAEAMELPENTVRTHLHRARKRLRELMSGYVSGEDGSWEIGIPSG
jgi:RNA polymerase sigma-70 factor (ECF subfamily)